ncbi:hypothetical protein ACOME3_005228 [Neoechinorhynchus agilis]
MIALQTDSPNSIAKKLMTKRKSELNDRQFLRSAVTDALNGQRRLNWLSARRFADLCRDENNRIYITRHISDQLERSTTTPSGDMSIQVLNKKIVSIESAKYILKLMETLLRSIEGTSGLASLMLSLEIICKYCFQENNQSRSIFLYETLTEQAKAILWSSSNVWESAFYDYVAYHLSGS